MSRQTPGRKILKFNLTAFNIILLAVLLLSAVSYLAISNQQISSGFAINGAKGNLADLNKKNRELEFAAIGLESYEKVNRRAAKLGMVAATDVEYLEVKGGEIAMR